MSEGFSRIAAILFLSSLACAAGEEEKNPSPLQPIENPQIEQVYRYTDHLISGAQPETPEDFARLHRWGVRTVISVDGALPEVETAARQGLRYIHLPFGYDRIPAEQALRLAKAVAEATGTVYVHCHHGLHRGPSAAALAMVMLGEWSPETAVRAMHQSGTGQQYQGLYQCVSAAQPVDPEILHSLPGNFTARAETEPMVAGMANINRNYDHLQLSRTHGWEVPADHPDIDPPHEALLLKERFHELNRLESGQEYGKVFAGMLRAAEESAAALEQSLRKHRAANAREETKEVEQAWALVAASCKSCHRLFRDNGIPEPPAGEEGLTPSLPEKRENAR